jgi:hypothetical protein
VTTYDQLLDRTITEGIAEVRKAYDDPKDHHKRDGAIEGFEACRGKTPEQIVDLWTEAEKACATIRAEIDGGDEHLRRYWRARYKTLQIEFVCNVISVGLISNGQPPLLTHLPTARGALQYARIVGVRGDGSAT